MALNLILMAAWVLITGEFTPVNSLAGFILGYLTLLMVDRMEGIDSGIHGYVRRLPRLIRFGFYFIGSIVRANFEMVRTVLMPEGRLKPAIVAVPLALTNPAAITIFANWITLTPGTLSLDISDDRKTLFVHTFQCEDEGRFVEDLKRDFESRVMEVFE